MKIRVTIVLGLLLLIGFARPHVASPDQGLNLPIHTKAGLTATIALGIEESMGPLTSTSNENSTTFSDGNYQIQVIDNPTNIRSSIRVIVKKQSGEAFRVNGFSI